MPSYDVLIIGSGQSGSPLASAFAQAGRKTALVEMANAGGTCINLGCTPTKTMIASASAAYVTRRAGDFGVEAGSGLVDIRKVRQRKDEIVASFRGGSERRIVSSGVDLIYGSACFTGKNEIEVKLNSGGTTSFTAEKIVINTGGRPRMPAVDGLDRVPSLNSTTIMELDQLPDHLVILGGGYVGVEFGQMFRRFGCQVTIIQRGGQLLGREDEDVADGMRAILVEDGINILLQTKTLSVDSSSPGEISVQVQTPQGYRSITGSHLLVATGRMPNTDQLNLSAAGVQVDKDGFIQTNLRLETSAPGIYATGDVKGGPAFTHISYDDYRILKTNILEGGDASIQGRMIPYVVFTDPQLGRIGLTEGEARRQGLDIAVAKMPMNYVARAIEIDRQRGFMKAIVDKSNSQILGAAILGVEGGEIMAMIQIAMMGKLPFTTLKDAIFAHPTLAESLNNLFNISV